MKAVRFLEEALEEFLDQVAYYEEREKGLGERFRLAVQAATTLAATHPKLGSPWKLRTRRVFPKRVQVLGRLSHRARRTCCICSGGLPPKTHVLAAPPVTPNPSTRTSPRVNVKFAFGCFPLISGNLAFDSGLATMSRAGKKIRCDSEQTAHLQTALLHPWVRTQIRTAQSGSIRSTGLGTIAATQG